MRTGVETDVTGVVLAGGSSRRFGRDKLSEELRGRPLVVHTIDRLFRVCPSVVAVLPPGTGASGVPTGVLPVDIARDRSLGEGPLAGLATGLERVDTERALVAGGDMPALEPSVLRQLIVVARETGADAVVLADGGADRPLPCAMLTRPALEAAHRLLATGRRRLLDLLAEVRTVRVEEATWIALDPERRTLIDVDEPADLERLRGSR